MAALTDTSGACVVATGVHGRLAAQKRTYLGLQLLR